LTRSVTLPRSWPVGRSSFGRLTAVGAELVSNEGDDNFYLSAQGRPMPAFKKTP
jgi:hypothetical protein